MKGGSWLPSVLLNVSVRYAVSKVPHTMAGTQSSKKKPIPKSLKENVWLHWIGPKYSHKCHVAWCNNKITPFSFEAGHDIPESRGGETTVENLRPICASCNKSMGNRYTIQEFSKLHSAQQRKRSFMTACFGRPTDPSPPPKTG